MQIKNLKEKGKKEKVDAAGPCQLRRCGGATPAAVVVAV
jgi:hypothetical protein